MRVNLESLTCISAFDVPGAQSSAGRISDAAASGPASAMVELRDVLYLPDVLERGQSLTVVQEHLVPEESVLDCWSLDFFQRTRNEHPEYARRYASDFDVGRASEPVCILGNLFSRNFGHWTEELLKVATLEEAGAACAYVLPTLPRFARDFLTFLGIDDDRVMIVDEPTLFERAVFTTAVTHENIRDHPYALDRLRNLVDLKLSDGSSRYSSRLWLERGEGLGSGGATANKDEVYRCIEAYGFDVVDMATLTVPDQLRTVRGASVIAGPHGSQFVHAQFMPRSSTIIECFSPVHVNPSILQICRVLTHSYRQVVSRSHLIAPYTRGRDCEVDCAHLRLVLDSL